MKDKRLNLSQKVTELLETIKKRAQSDFENKIVFQQQKQDLTPLIEKIYELTKEIYISSTGWITTSILSDAIRKLNEAKVLYQKIIENLLTENSADIFKELDKKADELIDLCLLQLHFYCGEINACSYWLDTVKEFKEQQFFLKHRDEFIPFTLKSKQYCLDMEHKNNMVHKLAEFMGENPTIFH